MAPKKLVKSLNAAVEGLIYVLKTQRNMRLHFLIAVFILVLGFYFNLDGIELLLLLGVITLVLVLEMVNTAVELTIDLVKDAYHPLARIIKDISAGAVFLSALNAVVVGYVVFSPRLCLRIEEGVNKLTHTPWHLTFIALIVVMVLVVGGKAFLHRGKPFRGGMPSGHAAFAFSAWTIIAFSTKNGLIVMITFFMAFLIARHRLKDNIHSFWEVTAGAILGILITTLVFQLLL